MNLLTKIYYDLRVAARNYQGFKFAVLASLNLTLVYALAAMGRTQFQHFGSTDAFVLVSRYIATYWIEHWRLFLWLGVLLIAVFWVDLLRVGFRSIFKSLPFRPVRASRHLLIKRVNIIMLFLLGTLILIKVPLLHLRLGNWYAILSYILVPIVVCAIYILTYGPELEPFRMAKPLAGYQFHFKTFDLASIGVQSYEAEREVSLYSPYRGRYDPKLKWDYVRFGDPEGQAQWKGHRAFLEKLATFIGIGNEPKRIRLFTATTDAITHALKEVADSLPANALTRPILTTDAEFDTITEGIHALTARRNMKGPIIANVRELVNYGASPERIANKVIQELHQRPAILCISHVLHESGFVMPIKQILDAVTELPTGEKPFIVIDGAQSVGQMQVDVEILDRVHFYATSGHKWLLGKETLGILVSGTEKMEPQVTAAHSIPVSLAHYKSEAELNAERSATINPESRLSLNCALTDLSRATPEAIEQHNRKLTQLFRRRLLTLRNVHLISVSSFVGMALVEVDNIPQVVAELSEREFRVGYTLGSDHKSGRLRICFHYFHSELDVHDLVNALAEATELE